MQALLTGKSCSTLQTLMCQLQYCKAVWGVPLWCSMAGLTRVSSSLGVSAVVLQGAQALTQSREGGTHRGK